MAPDLKRHPESNRACRLRVSEAVVDRVVEEHLLCGAGHLVQFVNWFSSIENMPFSLTSTFFAMQVRPVLSVSLAS